MKREYLEPEVEVVKFGAEDIITTSPPSVEENEDGDFDGDDTFD